ncbi:MAG TPA: serine hydrolase domain-containing protein [Pseudonocardiaceae bacterium]
MRTASESELLTATNQILNRHPAVGFALGVVQGGTLQFFHGHGSANIEAGTPITEDTIFRVASITKTFTAIAIMQLHEQGLVDLDAPANHYLHAFHLVPADPHFRATTVRDLLTHTSGVPEQIHLPRSLADPFGESVPLGTRLPTLGEYYNGALRLVCEPGTRFTYTDHNFTTLGQIVADVSGQSIQDYLREHIFQPLGMVVTDLVRSQHVQERLATGYALGRGGPGAITDREWITAAAASTYSSPRDMARYLAALLGGGANEHGRILRPETLAAMFEPQYRADPRVPGMGLAYSRYNLGGHLAIEHEGILPGFNSDIVVAPNDGIGVMAFTNGSRQAMLWLPAETLKLLGQLIDAPEDVIRTDVPQRPDRWTDLCGRYPYPGPLTDLRTRSIVGAGIEVVVKHGRLILRGRSPVPAFLRGFELHPDDENDPDVFRVDLTEFDLGIPQVVFTRDATGRVSGVTVEVFPLVLPKRQAKK